MSPPGVTNAQGSAPTGQDPAGPSAVTATGITRRVPLTVNGGEPVPIIRPGRASPPHCTSQPGWTGPLG